MIKSSLLLMALLCLASSLALHKHEEGICESCPADQQKVGLLCYPKCPAGYSRFEVDCIQNCPTTKGWVDQGLFCRLTQYGRGGGYTWKASDGAKNPDKGMYERCEKDNGKGGCEKSGFIVYPKCQSGFSASGCCICKPNPPNCRALGYSVGIDLSCSKKIIFGTPSCKLN